VREPNAADAILEITLEEFPMRNLALAVLIIASLTGCAAGHGTLSSSEDLRQAQTSTLQFYNNTDLRERTITACAAENEAEYSANIAMTGCKNASAAQLALDSGRGAPR
jgi:hypothetical protein